VRKRFIAVQREGLEEEVRQRTIIDLVSHYKYPLKFWDCVIFSVKLFFENLIYLRFFSTPFFLYAIIY